MLATLSTWVDQIPPVTQSLRYGNPAFRTWHAKVAGRAQELMRSVLPEALSGAAVELGLFLSDSLGGRLIFKLQMNMILRKSIRSPPLWNWACTCPLR